MGETGGAGPVELPELSSKEEDVAEQAVAKLTVGLQHVQAKDWALPGSFTDVTHWIKSLFDTVEEAGRYKLVFREYSTGSRIQRLFVKMSGDVRIFSLLAHSSSYPPTEKAIRKGDPMQLMSFGDGDGHFVRFVDVASALNKLTTRKDNRYHFFLLGCCHGDKLVPLLKQVTTPDGVLVYFGADEEENDGAATGLISEFWELLLENVKDRVESGLPVDCKEVFEATYVEVGKHYLAPTGQERVREANGDFKYCRLVLDQSVKNAEKDPSFVKDYTYAGDMQAVMGEVQLVTPELKNRRKQFFADKQRDVDERHAPAPTGGAGAPSLSAA